MLGSTKAEVTRISETVARTVFIESNLIAMLEGEIHSRLPESIHQHARELLPNLSKLAVAGATPDIGEMRAAIESAARQQLEAALPELITSALDKLLPGLAADAVREAAPELREELVTAATAEVIEAAQEPVIRQAATMVAEGLEKQATELLAELARSAVVDATPELVREGTAATIDLARTAVEEAAPAAVQDAAEKVRGALEYAVRQEADEILPGLARDAMAALTPQVHDQLTATAVLAVTDMAKAVAGDAVPEVVAKASEGALQAVRAAIREEAAKAFEQYSPQVITVVLPQGKKVELGADTHAVLPELLVALHARCHVLLVGPAGTGKSMLAKHAAGALGLDFHALSLGPTTPMSKVFGYYDAHGAYHPTPFRRAFEHGGVMLLDELDNGHPGLLAELNQALALGTCAFADRMVDAHEDFRLVATGNTYGTGGDRNYVGRQTLDSATLDRFVVMDVPIDGKLEERIALRHAPSHPEAVEKLLAEIRDLRFKVATKKLPVIISPRASIDGAKLLEAGATVEQVFQWRVVRGLSDAHRKALGLS